MNNPPPHKSTACANSHALLSAPTQPAAIPAALRNSPVQPPGPASWLNGRRNPRRRLVHQSPALGGIGRAPAAPDRRCLINDKAARAHRSVGGRRRCAHPPAPFSPRKLRAAVMGRRGRLRLSSGRRLFPRDPWRRAAAFPRPLCARAKLAAPRGAL